VELRVVRSTARDLTEIGGCCEECDCGKAVEVI